jgi:methyl-accepting chemotaxis protein
MGPTARQEGSLMGTESIRRALTRAIVLTTGSALLLSLVGLVALQLVFFPREAESRLAPLGSVVAVYSEPAIYFDDEESGEEALAALAANPEVVFGAIVLDGGRIFATYGDVPDAAALVAIANESGLHVSGTRIDWVREVGGAGTANGRLVLRADMTSLVAEVARTAALLAGVGVLSLIAAVFIGARLRERIAGPLSELAGTADAMASGDLSTPVAIDRRDEIGLLADAFGSMGASLRELVSQVRGSVLAVSAEAMRLGDASQAMFADAQRQESTAADTIRALERVGASVREMSDTVDSLAESASESNGAMSEIDNAVKDSARNIEQLFEAADGAASSVLEMSAAVRQIAGNAESLSQVTDATLDSIRTLESSVQDVEEHARESHESTSAAAENARRGEQAVEQTIGGMAEIAESFEGLERIVGDLALRSHSIHEVSQVIQGVVERTNLLALNAAIISSQAGEHGKAFAVVAGEVKDLADRTAASTQEIADAITAMLSGVESAVAAAADGSERVRQGRACSVEAGQVLREIRQGAEKSSAAVGAIVAATANQSQGMHAVGSEIERVKELVEQIRTATQEQGNASSHIQANVVGMRRLAEDMKRATTLQTDQSRLTTEAVDRLAAGLAQIRDVTKGQSGDVAMIIESIQVFLDGATESTRRAEAMNSTVGELSERANGLEGAIGQFQV